VIVVFGSIVLDLVVNPPRLPQRGETVLADDYRLLPGGKGANQALAAARAGADVRFVGCIGDDAFAATATTNLAAAAVDLAGLRTGTRPTACAAVVVDARGDNQIVVAGGANAEVSVDQLAMQPPAAGDICLLQMEIPLAENWSAVQLARQNGARVVLNAAPFADLPEAVLSDLGVLIVNEVEAAMLGQTYGLAARQPVELAAAIARRGDTTVVVTLGGDGAVATDGRELLQAPALPVEVVDTVGAGDAFVGAYAAALAENRTVDDCLRRGCVAGSLACRQPGAQAGLPDRAAIDAAVSSVRVSRQPLPA